jgi:hypothetical protein
MENFEPKFLISTTVNGNEVKLYRKLTWRGRSRYTYYIHWGVPQDGDKSIQELTTPKGRDVSLGGAMKQFFAAAKAAQYLTFSKL